MRPFDPAPDLLPDAQAINAFMAEGMPAFALLARHFGLDNASEAALHLGIALQAYAQGDVPVAIRSLKSFAGHEARLEVLARVFEVLYKAVTHGFATAMPHWVQFAVELLGAHPRAPEAQRLALEFFTYFGLWDHALAVHSQLPPAPFAAWLRHIKLARARAQGFQPHRRFSFVVLTWNRADLLDRCLTEIRAKAGSDDYELRVGVNASVDHTAEVLRKHGVNDAVWNTLNDSIDYYRALFEAAQGEILIEIDDNVVALPRHFDLVLERHLAVFPEHGYIGFAPTRLDLATGQRDVMPGALGGEHYRAMERAGLALQVGPTWGCCAAIRKQDWLDFGGFYGLRMSKTLGEEPQITRKLSSRGRGAGMIHGEPLLKAY